MTAPEQHGSYESGPMAEFLHLPLSEEFEKFMHSKFDRLVMQFRQLRDFEIDGTLPSEISEVLFYGTSNVFSGGIAKFDYYDGVGLLDFNFAVNDKDYNMRSSTEGTVISTTGYDESELSYRFDESMSWRFLLSLLHKQITDRQDAAYELPDDFLFMSDHEKIKIALTMLGEASGVTDTEFSIDLIDDPMDAAYVIKYKEAQGEGFDSYDGFDISNVEIEMDWQNAEGRYTLVKISTSQLLQQGMYYSDSFGLRAPTEFPHLDYPFAKSIGLTQEPNDTGSYYLDPKLNFLEWQRAVAAVMSRLNKHL